MCGDGAVRVHHRHLPDVRLLVGGDERGQRLLRRLPGREQVEAERPVAALAERLGRNRAYAGPGPQDRCAAGEGTRLDGDAQLAGIGVPGDDRVGQGDSARIFAFHSRLRAW